MVCLLNFSFTNNKSIHSFDLMQVFSRFGEKKWKIRLKMTPEVSNCFRNVPIRLSLSMLKSHLFANYSIALYNETAFYPIHFSTCINRLRQ